MNKENSNFRLLRVFLWLSVVSSGIGLGAKLFDLIVVAGAWGASPPDSFRHLPYGPEFPVDPGSFFQPLSALILIGYLGGLVCGWNTNARRWMAGALGTFVIIWAITPTAFWPMINEMWEVYRGRLVRSEIETSALVQRWIIWDSFRIVLIALGQLFSLKAFSLSLVSIKRFNK